MICRDSNIATNVPPVLFAQLAFEYFAYSASRQRIDDIDTLWRLDAAKPFLTQGYYGLAVNCLARLQLDTGKHGFTPFVIRNADNGTIFHGITTGGEC